MTADVFLVARMPVLLAALPDAVPATQKPLARTGSSLERVS
ncbi:hypothetical protein [Microbacterium pseudoresistens]|uniref:Uncharacterized protein n=1 Tax=Microbacterium pseudoresistens TaxID=640634 RepID=A0A7Y9EVM1_9MICO|nr:hypothetical protein [Microbacterium pseudoresistens]NYD54797.1 hypothetical protein [Microbacterium pseudoresistens]